MSYLDEPVGIAEESFADVFRFSVRCQLVRQGCFPELLGRAAECAVKDFAVPFFEKLDREVLTRRMYSQAVQWSAARAMEKLHLIM